MGRHTTASCKLCRREGEKLMLKGERCFSEKCAFSRRAYAPGQHGRVPVRASDYRIRLREKQKARRIYGLTEGQFENYFEEASARKGSTGERLLEYLERRLDNVVNRLGFTPSRQSARQTIRHGGVMVNGSKVNIPSLRVKAGDTIKFKPKISNQVKAYLEKNSD
jgi:small subunit ribosomal protein S4